MKRANRGIINILTGQEIGAFPALCGQKGSRTQIVGVMDILENANANT